MSRDHFGAQEQVNSVRAQQSREIGLRAVAAALLYRGDAHNVEHTLCRELSAPSATPTSSSDREIEKPEGLAGAQYSIRRTSYEKKVAWPKFDRRPC